MTFSTTSHTVVCMKMNKQRCVHTMDGVITMSFALRHVAATSVYLGRTKPGSVASDSGGGGGGKEVTDGLVKSLVFDDFSNYIFFTFYGNRTIHTRARFPSSF